MTSRARFALSTLAGPWLLLPALGIEIATFLVRGMPWRGEGMWTVDWFAISLYLVGPLAAGAAAVDASRLSRPGNLHLVVGVPRSWRVYARAAAWSAIPLMVLHLVTIVVALLVGDVRQPGAGWLMMSVAAVVQCFAILWFVALGSAIGRFVNPLLAGLAGAAAGYVLNYLVSDALDGEPRFRLLALGAATVTLVGRGYNPGYLVGQLAVLGITSALFVVVAMRVRSGVRLPSAAGAVAAAISVVMIAFAPAVLPDDRRIADPRPPGHCLGEGPEICFYYEHRRYAELIEPRIRTLTDAALEKGYPAFVPERIMEVSHGYRPDPAEARPLWLPSQVYEEGRYTLEDAAYDLLLPAHCEFLNGPALTPEGYDEVFFSLLGTWLEIAGAKLVDAPVEHRTLTPAEVSRALDGLAACEVRK